MVIAGDGSLCPVLVLLEWLGEESAGVSRDFESVKGNVELKMIFGTL